MGFTIDRDSQKGLSRRRLERPLGEYDPSGACPKNAEKQGEP